MKRRSMMAFPDPKAPFFVSTRHVVTSLPSRPFFAVFFGEFQISMCFYTKYSRVVKQNEVGGKEICVVFWKVYRYLDDPRNPVAGLLTTRIPKI